MSRDTSGMNEPAIAKPKTRFKFAMASPAAAVSLPPTSLFLLQIDKVLM